MTICEAWRLTSTNDHFGGYSALAALSDTTLVSISDRGRVLRINLDEPQRPRINMGFLAAGMAAGDVLNKHLTDVESMTRDPQTGQFWTGYEGENAIERVNAGLNNPVRIRPPQMRGWSANSGPEALVRLADGRFIVLSEGSTQWHWRNLTYPGLLFAHDPVEGGRALSFRFAPPEGYRPVDLAQIPDGRLLLLLRELHYALPPRFTTKIMLLDPADITPGGTWSGRVIATFAPPLLTENFEGLAVWPRRDGMLDLWIISDDNLARFQRTLLLKLRWDPRREPLLPKEKARSPAARLAPNLK